MCSQFPLRPGGLLILSVITLSTETGEQRAFGQTLRGRMESKSRLVGDSRSEHTPGVFELVLNCREKDAI